ncbi:MAG: NADH:ubiquinone reductase (Na(+)-transporting) subunit F [Candidatus Azobacteroides sp.]|nr:NADH:ubiquinone reductase (Na(+)-transporting) subunit F [Candidatus Azobacteroides sp.]
MLLLDSKEILTAGAGITVFLMVTMVLVMVLLYAKQKLLPQGNVKIVINEEKELTTSPGGNILTTLGNNQIFLPSACGGGGTCGMCKCRVLDGGGSILPTETGFFTRKEIQNHWRLGCQVKIKNDLKLEIPREILGIKKWVCEVVSNHNVASFIKEFVVKLPEGETLDFISGSYIQIDVPEYSMKFSDIEVDDRFKSEWDKFNLWKLTCSNEEETFRAYSMANHPAEGNIIMLNIRIATPPFDKSTGDWAKVKPGICSSYLFGCKPGDKVTVSGPYGDFHPILDSASEMLYIGGGAGMAPLRSHIMHLLTTLNIRDRKISYWYGARSENEIFYENDFRELEKEYSNFTFQIALSEPRPEDHWNGYVGFIHQVLYDNYLKNHEAPEDIEYYMCGPGPMAKAVEEMLDSIGVPEDMLMFDDFG